MQKQRVFLIVFILAVLAIPLALAATTSPSQPSVKIVSKTNSTNVSLQNTRDVDVALYILNLGKLDMSTGTFTVDFYLDMTCEGVCPQQDFEFMNGRANSVDKIIDTPSEKFYRIQAQLNTPIDLKRYPLDSQKLQIILEDKKQTISQLRYKANMGSSGLDDSVNIPGWKIAAWDVKVTKHEYSVYEETYSQYEFTITLERARTNSIIKTFLPVAFIVLVMLSSFILDPDKISTRLGMVGSALVASVMFHVSLTNQIPPVGYLTVADKFMMLTYFVLLVSFGLNVALMELIERKKVDKVEKLHRITEFSMIFLVPLAYVIFFWIVL